MDEGGGGVPIFLLYWLFVGKSGSEGIKYGSFLASFGRFLCGAFARRENEGLH